MLRDYELALSNYRLISTDYKLDKAWKHYAGVQVRAWQSLFSYLFLQSVAVLWNEYASLNYFGFFACIIATLFSALSLDVPLQALCLADFFFV